MNIWVSVFHLFSLPPPSPLSGRQAGIFLLHFSPCFVLSRFVLIRTISRGFLFFSLFYRIDHLNILVFCFLASRCLVSSSSPSHSRTPLYFLYFLFCHLFLYSSILHPFIIIFCRYPFLFSFLFLFHVIIYLLRFITFIISLFFLL